MERNTSAHAAERRLAAACALCPEFPDTAGGILCFSDNEKKVIDETIDCKSKLSAWQLVDATHKETPWEKARENKDFYIDIAVIQEYFDGRR